MCRAVVDFPWFGGQMEIRNYRLSGHDIHSFQQTSNKVARSLLFWELEFPKELPWLSIYISASLIYLLYYSGRKGLEGNTSSNH